MVEPMVLLSLALQIQVALYFLSRIQINRQVTSQSACFL